MDRRSTGCAAPNPTGFLGRGRRAWTNWPRRPCFSASPPPPPIASGTARIRCPSQAALAAASVTFAVAATTWDLLVGVRPLAVPAAFDLFVLLGNPASGGAIPRLLLPAAYARLSGWLPNGAAVRDLTCVPTAPITWPLLVLAAWTAAGLGCALLFARRQPSPELD